MKLQQILQAASWDKVSKKLMLIFPNLGQNISNYQLVFNELHNLTPMETTYVIVFNEEIDDDLIKYTMVSAYNKLESTLETYCIALAKWEEWLGMELDSETLKLYSIDEILANCLCEMTFYGFNQRTIRLFADSL